MATTNPSVTASWAKIVDDGDEFLLTLPWATNTSIEVATKDTDEAPTVQGHVLRGERADSMNRSLIGPGYVFARGVGSGSLAVVLNAWTPS